MSELDDIRRLLENTPKRSMEAMLVRCVALQPLIAAGAPDFLFTSGRANRYNPTGVSCVYFSETEATARLEFARRFGTDVGVHEPLGTYFANVSLSRVIDLEDQPTRDALKFKASDLTATWAMATKPIRSQILGQAVSLGDATAIRYPSDAARASGKTGYNVVIFRDSVKAPDYVHILGPTQNPLQKWPS